PSPSSTRSRTRSATSSGTSPAVSPALQLASAAVTPDPVPPVTGHRRSLRVPSSSPTPLRVRHRVQSAVDRVQSFVAGDLDPKDGGGVAATLVEKIFAEHTGEDARAGDIVVSPV